MSTLSTSALMRELESRIKQDPFEWAFDNKIDVPKRVWSHMTVEHVRESILERVKYTKYDDVPPWALKLLTEHTLQCPSNVKALEWPLRVVVDVFQTPASMAAELGYTAKDMFQGVDMQFAVTGHGVPNCAREIHYFHVEAWLLSQKVKADLKVFPWEFERPLDVPPVNFLRFLELQGYTISDLVYNGNTHEHKPLDQTKVEGLRKGFLMFKWSDIGRSNYCPSPETWDSHYSHIRDVDGKKIDGIQEVVLLFGRNVALNLFGPIACKPYFTTEELQNRGLEFQELAIKQLKRAKMI